MGDYARMADDPVRTGLLSTGLIEVSLLALAATVLAILTGYGIRRTPAEPRHSPVPAGSDLAG
jgi:hypothetical protein